MAGAEPRPSPDAVGGAADAGSAAGASAVNPLVALIRSQPGMAQRLLAEHADDGSGRCRVCSAGAQAGRYIWPCAIHGYAAEASEVKRPGDAAQWRST